MKLQGFMLVILLAAGGSVYSQTPSDTTFSLFVNSGLSVTHASDAHINHWLKEYGYPTEPHVPTSLNFEAAALAADSRVMYTIRFSTIVSGDELTSFTLSAGAYAAVVKSRSLLVLVGGMIGYHADIITLDGQLPTDYEALATAYNVSSLALRRDGLSMEPGVRIVWYPVHIGYLQIGIFGGLGYDIDLNSQWRLGYYSNEHGKYNHFRKLNKPSDQQKVSEHGFSQSTGLSFRFNLN
jgi:hypothetical protein